MEQAKIKTEVKKALRTKPRSNSELREALGIEKSTATGGLDSSRLDRTLQELRKAGEIKVIRNRWHFSDVHVCPKCEGRGWVQKKRG